MSTLFFATTAGADSLHAGTIYRLITEISTTDRSRRFMPIPGVKGSAAEVLRSLLGVAATATIIHFDGNATQMDQLLNKCSTVGLHSLPRFLASLPQPKIIILNRCAEQSLINQFNTVGNPIVFGTTADIPEAQAVEFMLTFYREFLFGNRTLHEAYRDALGAARIQPQQYANFGGYGRWRSEQFCACEETIASPSQPSQTSATRRNLPRELGQRVAGQISQDWQAGEKTVHRFFAQLRNRFTLSTGWLYSHRSAQVVAILVPLIAAIWSYTILTTGEDTPPAIPLIQLQVAAEQLAPIQAGQIIEGVAFGHDSNSFFATSITSSIYQWRLPTGEPLIAIDTDTSSVNHIALDHTGSFLAYSGRDGAVGFVSMNYRWQQKLEPHVGAVTALQISHNGRFLFTGSMDGVLQHHDLVSNTSRFLRSEPSDPISAIVTDPTDELLAFATNQSIHIWRWETRESLYQLAGHQGPINWLAFTPDGQYLLSAGSDNLIYLWDVDDQQIVHRFADATSPVNVVRYFPDGSLIVAAGDDGMIRVWDAYTYEKVEEIEGFPGGVAGLVINHNGSQIAAVGRNGAIKLWDVVPQHEERPSR